MKKTRLFSGYAFTLIELLIVVAIIAVLAAIAVPNFLEAQVRAKVSRVQADLRSTATGLEFYRVDNNSYPPYGSINPSDVMSYPAKVNNLNDKMCFCGPGLTTPIAYITSFFKDPFYEKKYITNDIMKDYEYLNMKQHIENLGTAPPWSMIVLYDQTGFWRIIGAGPDGDRGIDIKLNIVYDPSNGTVSNGDIVRSQKKSESRMRE